MSKHLAAQVKSAGGPLEVVQVETTSPPPGHVRLDVKACGVCGTDHVFVQGGFPNLSWPITPGHEIAGTIAELGSGVEGFTVGDKVAVGWFGGNCNHCAQCRRGQFMQCANGQVPTWHYPGGYAESVTVPSTALARIPHGLTFAEAAPMGCAGVTTFNGLRRSRAKAGDRVAILGIGGLGHLGILWANAMGFETIAIARGSAKAKDATDLGAHHYIDSTAGDVGAALHALGGAHVVLATAANSEAMAAAASGLAAEGELIIIGATVDPMPLVPLGLIMGGHRVVGHPSGTAADIEDTMNFAVLSGVRPRIEEMPLADAAAAYARMDDGSARYRMVLTM